MILMKIHTVQSGLLQLGVLIAVLTCASSAKAEGPQPLQLWPNGAPGETGAFDAEKEVPPRGGKPVIRLTNVTAPSLTFYPANPANRTDTTVIVFPGGGYHILAYDLEGTEIIEWLNSIGVNGVLLKYRVPRRPGRAKHDAPLQDAQRAIGLVRHRAKRWNLDPARIGVLGFSAGGHLAAMASNHFLSRTYPRVDASDDVSCRPNFTVLIYPAYLTQADNLLALTEDLTVGSQTPPSFIIQTQDDGVKVESSLVYYLALKQNKIPVEMHLYPKGGHGYGLRPSTHGVSRWPRRCSQWLQAAGLIP